MSNPNYMNMTDGSTVNLFEFIDLDGACSNIDTLQTVTGINSALIAILGSTAITANNYKFYVKNFRQKFQNGGSVSYINNSPVACSVEIPNESTAGTFRSFILKIPGYNIEVYNNDKVKFVPAEYYKEITPIIFEAGVNVTNTDELKRIYNMLCEGVIPLYKGSDMYIYPVDSHMCVRPGGNPLTATIQDYAKMTHPTSGSADMLPLIFYTKSGTTITRKMVQLTFNGDTLNSITVPS